MAFVRTHWGLPAAKRRNWIARCGLLLGLASGLVPLGTATGQPVLHEPVPAPSLRCFQGVCKRDGVRSDGLPDAVLGSDGMLGAPRAQSAPQDHEPILSPASQGTPATPSAGAPTPGQDPPPVRRVRVAPDDATGAEAPGERVYHEVFNPAVFPYKRMTVLDSVDEDGFLQVQRQRPHEVPVEGNRLIAGRDPFYASVVVDLEAGKPIPLPTPAAGLRLLSYEATPPAPLRFSIDAAENLSVQGFRGGRHRLLYLVDAPQRYFAGPLIPPQAAHPRLGDLPSPPPVPSRVRREAARVLAHLGLRPSPASDYFEILNALVAYFRDFSIAPLSDDDDGKSLYLRIAFGQRGVCRHRSYAFVITALAAGIPVRYVENELHVFVEVLVPAVTGQGSYWRRINLGGAPLEQRVMGGESRVAYQEKGGDPFERPTRFRQGRAPSVSGLPRRPANSPANNQTGSSRDALPALDGPEDRAKRSTDASTGGRDPQGNGSGSGKGPGNSGSGPGNGGSSAPGEGPGTARSARGSDPADDKQSLSISPDGTADDGSPDEVPPPADDLSQPDDRRPTSGLATTRVSLWLGAARRLYRGAAVPVRGQVHTSGTGTPSGGLDVYLLLATPTNALVLGRTVSRPDGSFALEVTIPASVPLGSFPLVARVRGDDQRRGSSSGRYVAPTEGLP